MEKQLVKRIVIGYIVVAIFLLVFLLLTYERPLVTHQHLNKPQWAGVVALVLVLPLILMPSLKYLWPRLTGVKISNLFEMSLTPETTGIFAKRFNEIGRPDENNVVQYTVDMGDHSTKIIELVKELERSAKKDAIVVDLKRGHEWIVPNLYFLTFLIARQRLVDQIVFVETGLKDKEFIAMCSPEELVIGLETKFPEYSHAKEKFEEKVGLAEYRTDQMSPVKIFFTTLQEHWKKNDGTEKHRLWLNSRILAIFVGNYLHAQHLEKKEQLSEIDYRHIINSRYSYTAIVNEHIFDGLINQNDLALRIARVVMD